MPCFENIRKKSCPAACPGKERAGFRSDKTLSRAGNSIQAGLKEG
jgi:hypothetical protein